MVVSIVGPLALGMTGNALYDLTKTAITTAVGEEATPNNTSVSNVVARRSGDFDALVEAIEPALKKAHYGIDKTATKITIRDNSQRELIVELKHIY